MANLRNAPCPCGSGKKYKHCHMAADQARGIPQGAGVLPGPAKPGEQLREVIQSMLDEDADEGIFGKDGYDRGFLELAASRCNEVHTVEEQATLLGDCHAELDAGGAHPRRVATHNFLLARLVGANLAALTRSGVTAEQAKRHFQQGHETQEARRRLEP
ncbi:MAG: SEC-C domain-containing protein [Halobacteriales archaeon]|nr:SEC-C domain-containing protein [Halobacteriales archaeon]